MSSRSFTDKPIWITVIVLAALALGLGLLNLQTAFSVRGFNIINKVEEKADIYSQTFAIFFNRPIAAGQDLNKLITIEPAQQLYFSNIGDELLIQTSQVLQADTAYKLKINNQILDIFNQPLGTDFQTEFQTRPLDLYYVTNIDGKSQLTREHIDSQSREAIFTTQRLAQYRVSKDMVAVIDQQSFDEQILKFVDLADKSVVTPLPAKYSVYDFQFVPNQNLAYFTARAAEQTDEYGVVYSTRKLYLLDLTDNSFVLVNTPSAIEDIEDLIISPDGEALLYRDTGESVYYLMDVTDPENPVSIGKYVATSGFNYTSQQLLFTGADFISSTGEPFTLSVDSERNETIIQDDTIGNIDPAWAHTSNAVVLAKRYDILENTKGLFQLELIVEGRVVSKFIKDRESVELPQVSPDDRYIAAESYTQTQLENLENLRSVGYQAKPGSGKLLIINASTWQVEREIEAINALWY